jgi:hypothetical protein
MMWLSSYYSGPRLIQELKLNTIIENAYIRDVGVNVEMKEIANRRENQTRIKKKKTKLVLTKAYFDF